MTDGPDSPAHLSFERDVRPLFREKDRDSMRKASTSGRIATCRRTRTPSSRSSARDNALRRPLAARSTLLPSNAGSREGRCPEP